MSLPQDNFFIPRRASEIPKTNKEFNQELVEQPLEKFRQMAAWVLLGEPGSGKTRALEHEANQSSGIYIRIAEFIDADIEPEWQGKTLFLDGLDEVRASGDVHSVIQKIRKQLKRLGCPPFRVSCRAADWHESTDIQGLEQISPDKKISQLQLVALDEQDISTLLVEKYNLPDPQKFIEESQSRGVFELLKNPQTLGLLVDALVDGKLPETRAETYQLACAKQLEEKNDSHALINRAKPASKKLLFDAAGQISAILLLSNRLGVALSSGKANEHFLFVDELETVNLQMLNRVVQSRLFSMDSQDRFVPSHRTIAEYLAARWLAEQLDTNKLPRQRVLNLLLGADGGVVASLRGLYAWLAACSHTARTYLIDADPLAVIIYGDPSLIPIDGKRQLLNALGKEARKFKGFYWDIHERHAFGALATPELTKDFLKTLQSSDRTDDIQSLTLCVLDILFYGLPIPELLNSIFAIIVDMNYWPVVRYDALKVWLKQSVDTQAKVTLLNDVTSRVIVDDDDEIAGRLLTTLYPSVIAPEKLLNYFHLPTRENYTGIYVMFWSYKLAEVAPNEHIEFIMDSLANLENLHIERHVHYSLARMVDSLLVRALQVCGDLISEERLFSWLGIGVDEYGNVHRDHKALEVISLWFIARPDKYKKILQLCCMGSEYDADPQRNYFKLRSRMDWIAAPDDIGIWHLQQVKFSNNIELVKLHLRESVNALINRVGDLGLSMEILETWAVSHPDKQFMLDELLVCDMPSWHADQLERKSNNKLLEREKKRKRTVDIFPHLNSLATVGAHVGLLNNLAKVWKGHFSDIQGESIEERFASYCENYNEVLEAAEKGFWLSPERIDLPDVDEIISLNIKEREHLIRLPCLVGMDLRWENGVKNLEDLNDESLRKMAAFLLTYIFNNVCPWFFYLINNKPTLIADVFIAYVKASLKSGKTYINCVYQLTHDQKYKQLAEITLEELLSTFPLRTQVAQLDILGGMLRAAVNYVPSSLLVITEAKLLKKGMDSAQKIYWYAVAMLLVPIKYENELWNYIGSSEAKANHLAAFLSERYESILGHYDLPIKTLSRLIEILTPHAEIDWGNGGIVSEAHQRGDQIRGWINQLGANSKSEAAEELERLLSLPQLKKIFDMLKRARHDQKIKQRESEFNFHSFSQVEMVLANRGPADVSDLAALILDVLDDIAKEIRTSNANIMKLFWKESKNSDYSNQKDENDCRDAILVILRQRLLSLGIDDVPEAQYFDQKRSDIRLSYGATMAVPIEIKRASHQKLWTAWRAQLVDKYAIDPKSKGFGIYLIFWFGDLSKMPNHNDKGIKPKSADELQARLEAQLDPLERQRIFIRVLDVSWPK